MQTQLAVIYANESNIWDVVKRQFDFFRGNINIDELSYAMPLDEARELLEAINKERKEEGLEDAYLNEISDEIEEIN